MVEDTLFCHYFHGRTTAKELFKVMDSFLMEANIKWNNCVGLCTDGVRAMEGAIGDLRVLVKQKAPNAAWTHCFVHREALASTKLSPELNAVMVYVVKAVKEEATNCTEEGG